MDIPKSHPEGRVCPGPRNMLLQVLQCVIRDADPIVRDIQSQNVVPYQKADADDQGVPGLAESWDYDEDTYTYTFHIRDGIKWHDGEPFTADDVKFTIEAVSYTHLTLPTNSRV